MCGVPAQNVTRLYYVQNNYYPDRHSTQPTVLISYIPFCLSQVKKNGLFSLCHVVLKYHILIKFPDFIQYLFHVNSMTFS